MYIMIKLNPLSQSRCLSILDPWPFTQILNLILKRLKTLTLKPQPWNLCPKIISDYNYNFFLNIVPVNCICQTHIYWHVVHVLKLLRTLSAAYMATLHYLFALYLTRCTIWDCMSCKPLQGDLFWYAISFVIHGYFVQDDLMLWTL